MAALRFQCVASVLVELCIGTHFLPTPPRNGVLTPCSLPPHCTPLFPQDNMDYDRKSTVSSFYGGRKSSDVLNADFAGNNSTRARDDASSFFHTSNRVSTEVHNLRPQNAGYNRSSFFHVGRAEPVKGGQDEEEGQNDAWDVYADFNNTGPRYTNAFSQNGQGCVPIFCNVNGFNQEYLATSNFYQAHQRQRN